MALQLLEPGTGAYEARRVPPIARFADVRPAAIARCASADDVVDALALAADRDLPVAVRSGGHCFEGRSSTSGLLVDVSGLAGVEVRDDTAVVGAGTRLGALYDVLAAHGRTVAAGCGPTVGVSGLALGGGLGLLGRQHGLTCDQLVAAEVVLADGQVVRCDEDRHADLFWALRGAGSVGLGVVTSLELRTRPAPLATTVDVRWPGDDAAVLIDAWQHWSPDARPELAVSLLVDAPGDPEAPATVRLFGVMTAGAATTRATLDRLDAPRPASSELRELPYRDAKRHLAQGDQATPMHLHAKSEFVRTPLPVDVVRALVEHTTAARRAGEARELDLSPWGGAYNAVAADATAFPHRDARFLVKHGVAVEPAADPADAQDWLREAWALTRPHGTGGAYVNFPDPDLADPDRAYFLDNAERVRAVKQRYDPAGVLTPSAAG